ALGLTSTGISQASPPSPPYPSSITSPGLTKEDAVPMVALEKHSAFFDKMVHFYIAIIQSILTSSITIWYAAVTDKVKGRLQCIICSAEKVTSPEPVHLQALESIVLRHLRPLVSPNMNPLQFAYQPGIGVDDACHLPAAEIPVSTGRLWKHCQDYLF
ncbi:hypothetical protein L3Q82_018160, partial [Scortum barcoo]